MCYLRKFKSNLTVFQMSDTSKKQAQSLIKNSPSVRVHGWSELRRLKLLHNKIILLMETCKLSQRVVSALFSCSRNLVRRALRAKKEGRSLGKTGRPSYLNEEDSLQLILKIKEYKLKRQTMKRDEVIQMV